MSGMNLHVGIKGLKQGTNILDVKVPAKLRQRVKTGVDWFDASLGGDGLVPSTVGMITGSPGAGKTTLMLQMANSVTKAGHICLFNTGEESLYQVRMVTERLGITDGFYCGQDIMVEELLEHADILREAHPKKQVFILQDSLQTLNDGFYKDGGTTGATPVRCTEMLANWAKDNFGIVFFIGQVTKGDGKTFAGKNTILHAVDVRSMLYIDNEKNSDTYGERIYTTTKNRFGCSGLVHIVGMGKQGLYEKGAYSGSVNE